MRHFISLAAAMLFASIGLAGHPSNGHHNHHHGHHGHHNHHHGHHGHVHHVTHNVSYNSSHAHYTAHQCCFRGGFFRHCCFRRGWCGWHRRCWVPRHGCHLYWCPRQTCWYGYDSVNAVYYPYDNMTNENINPDTVVLPKVNLPKAPSFQD